MATSSVPTVKAAILTLLQAVPALSTVQVTYAIPATDSKNHECVYMWDALFNSETEPFMRPTPRRHREDYVLPIVISVSAEGDDPQAAEDRMWAITGAVEDAFRTTPNPPGTTIQWAIVRGKQPVTGPRDGARIAENIVNVGVLADI